MGGSGLDDYCCDCGRLLFKGALVSCKLEIKCKKCGAIKTFIASSGILKDGEKIKCKRNDSIGDND